MEQAKFKEEEIPYHILARFGLTREMIEDLPETTYQRLKRGARTPVLPIKITTDTGNSVVSRSRISLVRMENGEVSVFFAPKLTYSNLSMFDQAKRMALYRGEVIIADKTSSDGSSTPAYHQMDSENGYIMSAPAAVVLANMKNIEKVLNLTQSETTCLKNGKPLTIAKDDKLMTIGIDLTAKGCIRQAEGDEQTWRNDDKRDWGKYNFGLNGCWTMDSDGNTDYVLEDDYTEEMWSELRRRGNQHQMKM